MGLLRLAVTGAAVAAAVHYVTKKRPDGGSIVEDLKAKAPDLMNKAEPYISQIKEQLSKVSGGKNSSSAYPEKFNTTAPDPDPTYTS